MSGAAPPLKASPEGWICDVMLAMRLALHLVLVMFCLDFAKGKGGRIEVESASALRESFNKAVKNRGGNKTG
jgi:hypothetical protein